MIRRKIATRARAQPGVEGYQAAFVTWSGAA
jgi:hypothetical protein